MDKEEILRRSREEGSDEWEEQLRVKVNLAHNNWWMLLAMVALIALEGFGFIEHWITSVIFLVGMFPGLFYGIYGYRKSKKNEYLATIVICIIGIVLFSSNIYSAWIGG